jgi:protein TonB
VFNDVLEIVTNDQKIETEINFEEEFGEDAVFIQQVAVVEETIEDDQPFVKVEQMPSFRGGDLMTFRNWVMEGLRYPQIAQENGIQGRVLLSFVIEKDGRLTNIQVIQTPDTLLSDEAIRVLKTSPKWTPGKQRNHVVKVRYTLPIEFRLID